MGRNAQRKRLERRRLKKEVQIPKIPPRVEDVENRITPNLPQMGSQMRAASAPADIVNHIRGKTVIAFLQEAFDCCSEKMIIEYINEFQRENYACLMVPRQNYTDILKYLASYVVLFRTGYKDTTVEQAKTILGYISYIKNLGIRVVYYSDDLIFWLNNGVPLLFAQASDAIIVATEAIKESLISYWKIIKPIIVVPTHINLESFNQVNDIPTILSNKFKILLTSSGRIGINHLYEICELINEEAELAQKIELIVNCQGVAQIRSVINKFRNIHKTYVDWISLSEYYALIKNVNLLLYPAREDDLNYLCPPALQQAWLDSKSEVKYTLAGAAKIPIIASPTAAYKAAITDGITGFLANEATDFVDKIRLLVNNPQLCREVGLAARNDIESRYLMPIRYPLYRDAIIGKKDTNQPSGTVIETSSIVNQQKLVFIPPIEGGPRTFYENMKKWLPQVSNNKWRVGDYINDASVAMAIAFYMADTLLKEKERRPDLKIVYRLDGLPMNFENELDPINLELMQKMFRHADAFVWQSKHCLNMWKEQNLVPSEVIPEGPIIHNGVDLSVFSPVGPLFSFPAPAAYNFIHLNWSTFKHKRLDLLQEIITKYASNPDIKFYMLGNYVTTSQIANANFWRGFPNVVYLGQMRNQSIEAKKIMASFYRTATALIFTSEMEGSPNTVLEALGCTCPVIYNSDTDIVPEILGSTCLPITSFDSIFDINIRQNLIKGMEQIREQYSMDVCIKKYLEVFDA